MIVGRMHGTIGAVGVARALGTTVAECADLAAGSGSASPSPPATTTSRGPAPSA